MYMANAYDLITIGSGPAGFSAAMRAARAGKRVLCVEKDGLGGTCLHWGCMPTKALLKSAHVQATVSKAAAYGVDVEKSSVDYARVIDRSRQIVRALNGGLERRFQNLHVDVVKGVGKITGSGTIKVQSDDGENTYTAPHILIATGCRPKTLPNLSIDGKRILSAKEALNLKDLPESALIVGGGVIGVEFATLWNAFGCKVTLVEALPRILPGEDSDVSQAITRSLSAKGVRVCAQTSLASIKLTDNGVAATIGAETLTADVMLVGIGMIPNTENLCDDTCKLDLDDKGFIKVNERYETSIPGVYAAGDNIGAPLLAHAAMYEGAQVAAGIFMNAQPKRVSNCPMCVYCQPQIGVVGPREQELNAQGVPFIIAKQPFSINGKAATDGDSDGFMKLLISKNDKRLLGAQIVHSEATEMLTAFCVALKLGANVEQLMDVIYAHPTLAELTLETLGSIQ